MSMKQITSYISLKQHEAIAKISKSRRVSMLRLIAFAIDNELMKDKPFEYDTTLPSEEYEEYAFADQAVKIINFINNCTKPPALDILLLNRFDIGIPDKITFLAAFKECLEKKMIEGHPAKQSKGKIYYGDDYLFYQLTGQPTTRSKKMKSKQYANYLKLKKKFEPEEGL